MVQPYELSILNIQRKLRFLDMNRLKMDPGGRNFFYFHITGDLKTKEIASFWGMILPHVRREERRASNSLFQVPNLYGFPDSLTYFPVNFPRFRTCPSVRDATPQEFLPTCMRNPPQKQRRSAILHVCGILSLLAFTLCNNLRLLGNDQFL